MESKTLLDKIYTPRTREIGRVCFYIALFLEVLIFMLDRADWYNPYTTLMFRIPFVLFVIKCLCTRYDKKQWIFIIVTAMLSFITYRISLKDEVIRAMVLVIAMKDLDLRRVLKFNYFVTSFGVFVLGFLSIIGICGSVNASAGYGFKAEAFMLSFGLGSSNTWAIQIWLLVVLAYYIYVDRLPLKTYGAIFIFGIIVFVLSKCRIEILMMTFLAIVGYLFAKFTSLRTKKGVYIGGGVLTGVSLGFSIYAAATSKWWEYQTPVERFLDIITTGRISSIYAYLNGGGVLSNWRLFGAPEFVEYFDMGWVRLFWWYGIIPGTLCIFAILWLFVYQYKKGDYAGFLLTVSIVLFTVLEAHFISQFLARAYLLFQFGDIWYRDWLFCKEYDKESNKHIAFYIGSLSKGGAERVFCNLAEYFISIGYKVTMITQYIREDEYELPLGVNRVISDLSEEEQKGRLYNFAARIAKLHRVIRETDADLLMTTIGKANFMAVTCAAFLRTRVVVSVVADPKEEYPSWIMKLLLQVLFGEADGIIMQTTRQTLFLRTGLRKVSTILPNSVSSAFDRQRYTGIRERNIVMVGRMDANKNQEMAINAFSRICDRYPDAKLVLMGDGELRQKLEGLVNSLDISEKVIFTGIVTDVADRLEKAYMFVLTSNTEGMPNTLLEAMSLGVACISTDCPCGGPADVIKDSENGVLVPVGDSMALSNAFDKLLSNYDYMDMLGKEAYRDMQDYKPDIVNAKWRDYYLGIINR